MTGLGQTSDESWGVGTAIATLFALQGAFIFRGDRSCSTLIGLRTGKTGLAAFLHWRKVLGYNSPCGPCGSGASEIPKHILVHFPLFQGDRTGLEDSGRVNLAHLLIHLAWSLCVISLMA